MLRNLRTFLSCFLLAACQAVPAPLSAPAREVPAQPTGPLTSEASPERSREQPAPVAVAPLAAELAPAGDGLLVVRVRWPEPARSVLLLPFSTQRLELVLKTASGTERGRVSLVRQPGVAVAEATMSARVGTDLVLEAEARDAADEVVATGRAEAIAVAAHVRTPVQLLLEPSFRPALTRIRPAIAGPGARVVLEGTFPVAASRSVGVIFAGVPEQDVTPATGALEVTVPEGVREGSVVVRVDGVPTLQGLPFRPLARVGFVATGDAVPWSIDNRLYGWAGGAFPFMPTGVVGSGSVEVLPDDAARVVLSGEGASEDGVWRPTSLGDGEVKVTSGHLVATADLRVGYAAPPLWTLPDGFRADRGVTMIDTSSGWLAAWQPLSASGKQSLILQGISPDGSPSASVAYRMDVSPGEEAMGLVRAGNFVVLATRADPDTATGSISIAMLEPDGRLPTDTTGRVGLISLPGEDLRLGTLVVRGSRVLLVCYSRSGLAWRLRTYAFETSAGRLELAGTGAFGFTEASGLTLDPPTSERVTAVPWGAGYMVWAYGLAGASQRLLLRLAVSATGSVANNSVVGLTTSPRLAALAPRPDGGAWLVSLAPAGGEFELHVRGFAHPTGAPADLDPESSEASASLVLGALPGPVPLVGIGDALVDPVLHAPSVLPVGENLLVAATVRRPDGNGHRPVVVWTRPLRLDNGSLALLAASTNPLADEGASVRLARDASGIRAIWRTAAGEIRTCRIVVPTAP
ncbi:MAG: hypothetical protein VKO64_06935 [Candidatus Sericytochromatia bacterium]|nr:hypothetical protein [Candidatus Sericytochromatia bacterium]